MSNLSLYNATDAELLDDSILSLPSVRDPVGVPSSGLLALFGLLDQRPGVLGQVLLFDNENCRAHSFTLFFYTLFL